MIKLSASKDSFRLAEAFSISRGSRTEAVVVTVHLQQGTVNGYGECVPYARYGETVESVIEQIYSIEQDLSQHPDPNDLLELLPPGAARNAVDCALWDFKAKRENSAVWQLAGLPPPAAVTTAYTLSLDTPQAMQRKAAEHAHRPLLKLKLGGADDIERLRAVRRGAPDTRIIVDANEGWNAETYLELSPILLELGVAMVEQPLPASEDAILRELQRELPVCADESCHDSVSLDGLRGKYDVVNIKLDKTGGLTEALRVRTRAEHMGFDLMVGCMIGSSLAMAPAMLVAQGAKWVDLDAPLLLAEDRAAALEFEGSVIQPPVTQLWG